MSRRVRCEFGGALYLVTARGDRYGAIVSIYRDGVSIPHPPSAQRTGRRELVDRGH